MRDARGMYSQRVGGSPSRGAGQVANSASGCARVVRARFMGLMLGSGEQGLVVEEKADEGLGVLGGMGSRSEWSSRERTMARRDGRGK